MLKPHLFSPNSDPAKGPLLTGKWRSVAYFFLGGISAGAYLIGRAADRMDGRKHRKIAAYGSAIALATIVPCPVLQIQDSAESKRPHHLATWAIVLFTAHVAFDSLRQYLNRRQNRFGLRQRSTLRSLMNNRTFLAIHDAAGVPLSMFVASYAGALLNDAAHPPLGKNPFIAPLLSAGAVANGTEAVSLALDIFSGEDNGASQDVLAKVDTAAHAVELAFMKGFAAYARENSKSLKPSSGEEYQTFSNVGTIAAEALKHLPVEAPLQKPIRMTAMAIGLAAGFAVRWAIVQGAYQTAGSPRFSQRQFRISVVST